MSICDNCRYRRDTWSEKLREDHNGCILLALEKFQDGIDESKILDTIDSEFIGLGWITSNGMAINKMIITKDTTKCKKYSYNSIIAQPDAQRSE